MPGCTVFQGIRRTDNFFFKDPKCAVDKRFPEGYATASRLIIDAGKSFDRSHTYQLFDINGATLSRGTLTSSKQSIDISRFPKGGYYLRVGMQIIKFVK